MENFFYNLVILIKLLKIRYLNLGKALLFPRNQAICLLQLPQSFFFAETLHASTKPCPELFLFCLDLELLKKNVKSECAETRSFLFFEITQYLNKIKKIPNSLL